MNTEVQFFTFYFLFREFAWLLLEEVLVLFCRALEVKASTTSVSLGTRHNCSTEEYGYIYILVFKRNPDIRKISKLMLASTPGSTHTFFSFSKVAKFASESWSSQENQKKFMDDLGEKIGVRELDGWYLISAASIAPMGASKILALYKGSLSKLLASVYPNHPWDLSKFTKRPRNYWSSLENQKRLIEELGEKVGVKDLDHWYSISASSLIPLGAGRVLNIYNGSLRKLLAVIYPNHLWVASKFTRKPIKIDGIGVGVESKPSHPNAWSSIENLRRLVDELGERMGIRDLSGWYSISPSQVISMGAGKALALYKGSLSAMLAAVYPNHSWDVSKFSAKPRNFWSSLDNQKRFMDELGDKVGVRELDGWYSISASSLVPLGAGSILTYYKGSLPKLLAAVYPDYPWDISRFSKRPQRYWSSMKNQKSFVDELGKKIGIHSEADFERWYEQSDDLFRENRGAGLLVLYNYDIPKLLATIYPNYDWQLWRFPKRIGKVVQSEGELDKLFANIETVLEIRKPEDWYRVTAEQLASLKVPFFYKTTRGGLAAVLAKRYPNMKWDENAFFGRGYRRATQRWLTTILADLLGSEAMLVDYSHPDLHVQLDVFFPELNLAFEYQGAQHYEQRGVYGDVSDRMARDEGKAALCLARGITLIAVPFWWNQKRPALLAAILAERPDLFGNKLLPLLEEARSEALRGSPSALRSGTTSDHSTT